jgi:hypothetical protein
VCRWRTQPRDPRHAPADNRSIGQRHRRHFAPLNRSYLFETRNLKGEALIGYRALAIKSGGKVRLRSRNDNDFNSRYPAIVDALAAMPDNTVIDGEIVALD